MRGPGRVDWSTRIWRWHLVLRLLAGLLLLAILAAPATAQLVPIGREQRVDTAATAGYCSNISVNADGGFTVAWYKTQDEGLYSCDPAGRLYTRTYDRDGTAEAPPFLAVRAGEQCVYEGRSFLARIGGGIYSADAAEMPDGGLVLVWSQELAGRPGISVHGRRFDAGGRPLGPAFLISGTDFASPNRDVMVAANEAGQFVVTWLSIDGPTVLDSYAMARAYGADGQPASPVLRVSPRARGSQEVNRPAIDEQGNFVVLWNHADARNPGESRLSARLFAANGQRLGPELRLADWSPTVQGCASVASLADGRWVVAWGRHPFYAGASGIYLQRFTSP